METTDTAKGGWLANKCKKYTQKETLNWVVQAWTQLVKPEFAKFASAIADQSKPIPHGFFEVAGISHGNENPLFRFLRPRKQLYISQALSCGSKSKQIASVRKALSDYLDEWGKCLKALEDRYPDNLSANECRHCIERIAETTNTFRTFCSEPLTEERFAHYKTLYSQTCDAFNAIPCRIASSQKTVDAVKEALKQSAVRKPIKRKKRQLSERQQADKKRIAAIVKALRKLTDPGPGKPKRSVLKALKVLTYRPAYGQVIKELNLSDNTWKKYVQCSKKKEP